MRARHSQQRIGPASDPAEDHIAEPCQHEARHAKGQQDQAKPRQVARLGRGDGGLPRIVPFPQGVLAAQQGAAQAIPADQPPVPLREQVAPRCRSRAVLAPAIDMKKGTS